LKYILKIIKAFIPYGLIILFRIYKESKNNISDKSKKELIEIKRWFDDNGDKIHRLNYESLNSDSIVFDLGGYKGDFACNIFSKYMSNIYVFEPVKYFINDLQDRFAKNHKVKIFPFGLGAKNESLLISVNNDSSSIFRNDSNDKENIEILCFQDFLIQNNINNIDLIKINIEGGEYELLEHIIQTDLISSIDNLQIQFHSFIPNANILRENIQKKLSETHHPTYNYDFVWENWKRNIL